jgi:hypothetical protein
MPAARFGGPLAEPTFQPVREKLLPMLDSTMVRFRMPGSVAMEVCGLAHQRWS